MKIGATEIILLLLLALVLFGGRKLTGIGKALGTSIRDFKREINADDKGELKQVKDEASTKSDTEEGS